MTKAKIAITIDEDVLADIKARVASGEATSVSAYIEGAVSNRVSDELAADDDWDAWADRWLERTGGSPTAEERAWFEAASRGEAGEPPTERLRG